MNQLSGQLRLVEQVKGAAQHGVLVLAGYHEHAAAGVVENGEGHGQAVNFLHGHVLVNDKPVLYGQGRRAGEERGGMPILAHAEQDHVEARNLAALEMKFLAQQFFVLKGGFHRVLIAAHTEKLGAGT